MQMGFVVLSCVQIQFKYCNFGCEWVNENWTADYGWLVVTFHLILLDSIAKTYLKI